jgi:hypothetical protein
MFLLATVIFFAAATASAFGILTPTNHQGQTTVLLYLAAVIVAVMSLFVRKEGRIR